jgi:hypothetical protein
MGKYEGAVIYSLLFHHNNAGRSLFFTNIFLFHTMSVLVNGGMVKVERGLYRKRQSWSCA